MTDPSDPPEQAGPLGAETVPPQPQLQAQPASPPQPTVDAGWDRTHTVAGGPGGGNPVAGGPSAGAGSAGSAQIRRYGPGVPSATAAAQAAMPADQVWQLGPPSGAPARRRGWSWRLGSTLLSAALVIASVVVILVRLHHPAFGVTGAAITSQTRSGCAVDVTARVATTGGAGTVSYEWAFTPQGGAPQPATQAVAVGQTAVYLTAAVQGQGHGTLQQQVTLRVLSPGTASAAASVSLSC